VWWCGGPIDVADIAVDFAAIVVVETSGVDVDATLMHVDVVQVDVC
jgi:hypothetical protein